jgi:hypothetical protein
MCLHAQALARAVELARRNTQLVEESEAMLQRLNAQQRNSIAGASSSDSAGSAAAPAGTPRSEGSNGPKQQPRRGLLSFRRQGALFCPVSGLGMASTWTLLCHLIRLREKCLSLEQMHWDGNGLT